jgi:hypothetical protein
MTDNPGAVDPIAREQIMALDRRLTEQMAAQKDANKIALDAAEKAVLKAEIASEKRFESVNEFRQTLSDQQGSFATKALMDAKLDALEDRLSLIEREGASTKGRGSISIPLMIALTGTAVTAVTYFMLHPH